MLSRITTMLMFLALALAPRAMHAQPADNKAAAEQLFNQARDLLKEGKFAEACPKFKASYKLDPAVGTLLNLARCYENSDELASAWGHYREVVGQAKQRGQTKRVEFAQARADELEPQIPRLTIVVPEANRSPGLTVERNGQVVDAALFGVAAYVDVGEYSIVAKAPGYQALSQQANAVNGQEVTVEISALVAEQKQRVPEQKQPVPERKPTIPISSTNSETQTRANQRTDTRAGKNTRRLIGLGTGGAGLVAVATGLGLGLAARSSWNDAFDSGMCNRDTLVCTSTGQDKADTARSRADRATLLLGVGAAATIAGVVLYLTAPKHESRRAPLTITPVINPNSAGISVTGRF